MLDGTLIRELRNNQGWSITVLHEKSGVSRSLIHDIETNKANPSMETLERLAAALNVTVTKFFREG